MNIADIAALSKKPGIYEKGTHFMWTDAHISKQLLGVHLNADTDLASRKQPSIEKTLEWILDTQKQKGKLNILDLGCGPGLYTERLAEQGHKVTGIDISGNSVEYARMTAKKKKLDIRYIHANYLKAELERDNYDLVIMIYTDMGVLTPPERNRLIDLVYRALKSGGTFIFDVLKDKDIETKTSPRTWEARSDGFWNASPYLALSESFLYAEQKVILYQHIVIGSDGKSQTYRFWTHFFSRDEVNNMLQGHGFKEIRTRDDILPEGDIWNGDHVIFAMATK